MSDRVYDERPAPVAGWCATWAAERTRKLPRLVEFDVLEWIETLEHTVDAQRELLRTMREQAAEEAAE